MTNIMKRMNVRQIWWSFIIHRFSCVIKLNRGQKIRRLGASSKKVVVLGGAHLKMANQLPPPLVELRLPLGKR